MALPTAKLTITNNAQAWSAGSLIEAGGDINIETHSVSRGNGYISNNGGGAIAAADVEAKVNIYNTSKAYLTGDDVTLRSDGQVTIHSDSSMDSHVYATAKGGGIGAGSNAAAVTRVDSDIANGRGTQTTVGNGATIDANTVSLSSTVSKLKTYANSYALAGGFVAVAISKSDIDADSTVKVLIDDDARIKSLRGVDITSTHVGTTGEYKRKAVPIGFIPIPIYEGNDSRNTNATVQAKDGARIQTAPRANSDTALTTQSGYDQLALYVKAGNTISWDADVEISAGPSPEILIDENGVVVKAIGAVVTVDGNKVIVHDISAGEGGEVLFVAPTITNDTADVGSNLKSHFQFSDTYSGITITNQSTKDLVINNIDVGVASEPLVDLKGNTSLTFNLRRTVSPTDIVIENTGTQIGFGQDIYLAGTIDNPLGKTYVSAAQGDIVAVTERGQYIAGLGNEDRTTLIRSRDIELDAQMGTVGYNDIENQQTKNHLAVDLVQGALVVFDAEHQLETGDAVVYNADNSANALNGLSDGETYYVIRLDDSRVRLAATSDQAYSGVAINIDPANLALASHSITHSDGTLAITDGTRLVSEAGADNFLDLRGLLRDPSASLGGANNPNPHVFNIDKVHAGMQGDGSAEIILQSSQQQSANATTGGVRVKASAGPAANGLYYDAFRSPVGQAGSNVDVGYYGNEANGVDIKATYNFINPIDESAGILAEGEGNIIITTFNSAPSATQVNVTGITEIVGAGSGHIDVLTNGFIDLVEQSGDMRVGDIHSTANDVTLTAPGSIIDALDDSDADVTGVNITLTALAGGIGRADNFLEINLLELSDGAPTIGALRADSPDSIYIEETGGDLRVHHAYSEFGNVSLVARDGSILDANNDTELDLDGRVRDVVNISANLIDLDANGGSIGLRTDDLDIDSEASGSGRLFAEADGNVFITEADGELKVLAATALGGDLRLTVPDTSLADTENLVLLAGSGTTRVSEEESRLVIFSDISAALMIALWVGDNVRTTSDSNSRVQAGTGIKIKGDTRRVGKTDTVDDANADATRGTQIDLRGIIGKLGAPTDLTQSTGSAKDFTEIFGHTDGDTFTFNQTYLTANTTVFGSQRDNASLSDDGEDQFIINQLRSMHVDRNGLGDTLTLDGQADTDYYQINTTGSQTQDGRHNYVINVLDTGAKDDGVDELVMRGFDSPLSGLNGQGEAHETDDIFLLRSTSTIPSESSESPSFVALLHGTLDQAMTGSSPSEVQRVNYDANLNGRLIVEGLGGNDYYAVDDNSVITTLDGGAGNDNFQIGQIFGTPRDSGANIAVPDDFSDATVATTRGYLSRGNSAPLVAMGGSGDDVFQVYSNQAALRLEGNDDNDLFIVRAFALAETNPDGTIKTDENGVAIVKTTGGSSTADEQIIKGGAGNDFIQYNINAPVSVDGGAGFDKLLVLGTEFGDSFVIDDEGVYGAGLNVTYENVESLEVDGLEGDDHFSILSTREGMATKIVGGLGNDIFNVAGDVTDIITTQELEGHSAIVNHQVSSIGDLGYDGLLVSGIDLNVAGLGAQGGGAGFSGNVIIDETDGSSLVRETATGDWGTVDSYSIRLAAPVAAGTKVYVTVSAARSPQEEQADVGTGDSVLVSTDPNDFTRSVQQDGVLTDVRNRATVLVFDSTNWDQIQNIYVAAANDSQEEGKRVIAISHSVQAVADDSNNASQQATVDAYNGIKVDNVLVTVIDNDTAGFFINEVRKDEFDNGTTVLEGNTVEGIVDSYTIELTKAPTSPVTIALDYDANQLQLSQDVITFDATNWDQPITITVTALDDTLREDQKLAMISHTVVASADSAYFDNGESTISESLAVNVYDNDAAGILVQQSNSNTLVSEGVTDTYSIRLTKAPTDTVTVTPVTDGLTSVEPVTFTVDNWWIAQELVITAVTDPAEELLHPGTKQFSVRPHLLSDIKGPLEIEGGIGGAVYPLINGVMLPGETNSPAFPIAEQAPEEQSIDILNIFDDSSIEDKQGVLSGTQLTGFNLSDGLTFSQTAFGENSEFRAGITYGKLGENGAPDTSNIEVLNLMLGAGNDTLEITSTLNTSALHGGITTVHGGGNLEVQSPVVGAYVGDIMGDRITVTGGAGPTSPLVVYGDTSQDASWYAGRSFAADIADSLVLGPNPQQETTYYRMPRANPFDFFGNDVIDASAITPNDGGLGGDALGVVLYGGEGNDTLYGSQLGDVLAGGSGDDTIFGHSGDDQIYGDSGINVDVISRTLSVPTTDDVRPSNDNPNSNRDALVAGQDTLHGNDGADIMFGDHGIVEQQIPDEQKILIVRKVQDIRSDQAANGADDIIHGDAGRDRILGGNGSDTITGGTESDVIFGDFGHLGYVSADYFGTTDDDIATLDVVESIDTSRTLGAGDTIIDASGDNIILGGQGGDFIDAGVDQNIVFGDHGRILGVDTGVNSPVENSTKTDDDYQVQTLGLVTSIAAGTVNGSQNEFGNGNDVIISGAGRDMIFAGGGDDNVNTYSSNNGIQAGDGNNIVFGDHGLVDYLSEEVAQSHPDNPLRTNDIDEVSSLVSATSIGGNDVIVTGDANDIVIGGAGDDVMTTGDGRNLAMGDNARLLSAERDRIDTDPAFVYSVHEFLLCKVDTIGFDDIDSGKDTITGGQYNDVLFGGGGDDTIYAGGGDDLVFGDQGRIECKNNQPFDPDTSLRPICWDMFPTEGFLLFEATNVDQSTGSGNDLVFGQDGSDLIMGQQGDDVLYGGNGDDILIGGSNISGALDGNDRLDGGAGHDAIAGDNAAICYRPDAIDMRMRNIDGTVIYGTTPGLDDGRTLVTGAAMADPRYAERTADRNSGHAQYMIMLLDHSDVIESNNPELFGNDYIAGGAGEDEIFGQLGNDVMMGDGTIGVEAGDEFARRFEASQISITRTDGTTVSIDDLTTVGANRGAVATDMDDFGFNMDPSLNLSVSASFEGKYDGDDYIEGNGGNDVIFGNLGQDDIIGGSSDLFGLIDATQRPDGSDLLFGGAGTDIARNDIGDATVAQTPGSSQQDLIITNAGGHAHDADVLVGDNGRIYRLVGVNQTQRSTTEDVYQDGVWSTGGFLNFNYDIYGSSADGYGSDNNPDTYDRIVVRAVEALDYHEGGVDFNPAASTDRGAGDELHGESGDDIGYGLKGNDVLFGEGQDDDLIGGYGNDWISGGTGDDGVLGDDGRILTSRNATTYGEALNGVVALLVDNGDTRTFNGNMMDEAIATPGKIQQATVNVGGELKKSVNITPFSFDPNFNGMYDEFTSVTKKTVDDQGLPIGHNADDIIFGGLGNDWLHGGSGDDAILGGEALSEAYTQTYDENGLLNGVARSDYTNPFNPIDSLRYNPLDVDGWHYDQTRRAGEFALYDEYDPLRKITLNVDGTANKTDAGGLEWFLNFSSTEGTYVPGAVNPKPVGQSASEYPEAWNDGNDRIFGDTGNDWLVGGTGRDNIYGGFGNDLINADDNHETNAGRNDQPDTQVSYEDRAFGGAGRDVLIANTGGDRLIDWVGEFNSYLVPFAPFGMATVSRTLQPQLAEFLYTLSASDGADATRHGDTNGDASQAFRNGEPEGELGLIRQKDFAWQTQTGAPTDPQAGNIPGGKRDVLRTASFNDGTQQGVAADTGVWEATGGSLQVSAESNHGDAVAIYHIGDALPSYFELTASIMATKPTAGWEANSYIIFDYQSDTNFKYAGLDVSHNKLVMGQRTEQGWEDLVQSKVKGGVKHDTWYNMMLSVNGLTATLVVDNQTYFSHTFNPTVIDSWSYGLNWGLVGFGSNNARGMLDNISVQVIPPETTVVRSEDFENGTNSLLTDEAFVINSGRFETTSGGNQTSLGMASIDGIEKLAASSVLKIDATFSTDGRAGFIFDQYSATDYKWVAIDVNSQEVQVGHRKGNNWTVDASVAKSDLVAGTDYELGITISGTTVSVTFNGQAALGHSFNGNAVDGRFGIFAFNGTASFDSITIQTNDPAFDSEVETLKASRQAEQATLDSEALTPELIQPVIDEAIRRLAESHDSNPLQVEALKQIEVKVVDLGGLELGAYKDGVIYIDYDAAGHGWFIDSTPSDDLEYRFEGDALVADKDSAEGKMDLLSVLMHEYGHALGLEHGDEGVMSMTLDEGVRFADYTLATTRTSGSDDQTPVINWNDMLAPEDNQEDSENAKNSKHWVTDFVNYAGENVSKANPNVNLKFHVSATSEVLPEVNSLENKTK